MILLAEPFWVVKRGSREEEYEDALWPKQLVDWEATHDHVVALADGATESLYARWWAEQLVNAVGEGRLVPVDILHGLDPLRAEWRRWVAGKKLPWYAEGKAQQGAFSALVLLQLRDTSRAESLGGDWSAAAIGDCCVFQVRGEEVVARFPFQESTAFAERPYLVGSLGGDDDVLQNRIARSEGIWAPGDIFYLMSDAIACWFLRQIECGNKPLDDLRRYADSNDMQSFATWIDTLRDEGSLRNDDTTVLRVTVA